MPDETDRTVKITIIAKGIRGSGKSRALLEMTKAISNNPIFNIIDSRFYEWGNNEEEQTIELVMS